MSIRVSLQNLETSVSNQSQSDSQMSSPEKRAGERKAALHNELMQLNDQLTKKEEFVRLLVKNEENFSKQRREVGFNSFVIILLSGSSFELTITLSLFNFTSGR